MTKEELFKKILPYMYCYSGSGMLTNTYDENVAINMAKECLDIIDSYAKQKAVEYNDWYVKKYFRTVTTGDIKDKNKSYSLFEKEGGVEYVPKEQPKMPSEEEIVSREIIINKGERFNIDKLVYPFKKDVYEKGLLEQERMERNTIISYIVRESISIKIIANHMKEGGK